MPATSTPSSALLEFFEPLIDDLRTRGFAVGVDSYLRLDIMLRSLASRDDRDVEDEGAVRQYGRLIRPIFATSPEQQAEFDAAFERFIIQSGLRNSELVRKQTIEAGDITRRENAAVGKGAVKEHASEIKYRQVVAGLNRPNSWYRSLPRRTKLTVGVVTALLVVIASSTIALWLARATYTVNGEVGTAASPVEFQSPQRAQNGPYDPDSKTWTVTRPSTRFPWLTRLLAPTAKLDPESHFTGRNVSPGKITASYTAASTDTSKTTLRLTLHNLFDRIDVSSIPLAGHGIVYDPTDPRNIPIVPPTFTLTFEGDDIEDSSITTPVTAVGDRYVSVVHLQDTLHRRVYVESSGLSISPKNGPFQFKAEPSFTGNGPDHVFKITFTPTKANAAGFDAILTYKSNSKHIQDPEPIHLHGVTQVDPTISSQVTVSVSDEVATRQPRYSPWMALLIAALAALLLRGLIHFSLPGGNAKRAKSPFYSPPDITPSPGPYKSATIARLADAMAPRLFGDTFDTFDIPATVNGAARSAGFSMPIYRPNNVERPQYLILIDEENAHDQQAAMFASLGRLLDRHAVDLEIFFFTGSPNYCVDVERKREYSLAQLLSLYATHRPLVFSDGHGLVELHNLEIGEAAKQLSGHPIGSNPAQERQVWALFTAEGMTSPSLAVQLLREKISKELFAAFPSTSDGVHAYLSTFPIGENVLRERKEVDDSGWRNLPRVAETSDYSGYVDALLKHFRRYDAQLFEWLCACALYPRLSYDLTILIGQRIHALYGRTPSGTDSSGPLVTEANLIHLFRLPWFRRNEMPEPLRLELLRRLKRTPGWWKTELEIRTLLIDLLTRPPYPAEDSVAHDRNETELRVQEWLRSEQSSAAELRGQIAGLPRYLFDTHPLLRRLLAARDWDLWADNPKKGKTVRFFFKYGIVRHDFLRQLPVAAILFIVAGILAMTIAGRPQGHRVTTAVNLHAVAEPATLTFDHVDDGNPLTATVNIDNPKAYRLTASISLSGEPITQSADVPPKSNVPLTISFAPSTIGPAGSTVDVVVSHVGKSKGSPAKLSIPVIIQKVAPPPPVPAPAFTPPSHNFVAAGGQTDRFDFKLTSTALKPPLNLRLSGGGIMAPFTYAATYKPGADHATITVIYAPAVSTSTGDIATLTYTDKTGTAAVNLTGGQAPAMIVRPFTLKFDPENLRKPGQVPLFFGSTRVLRDGQRGVVTVRNPGDKPIHVEFWLLNLAVAQGDWTYKRNGNFNIVGYSPNVKNFDRATDTGKVDIAAHGVVRIRVSQCPEDVGLLRARFQIRQTGTSYGVTIPCSGEGRSATVPVTVTPTSIQFGNIPVVTASEFLPQLGPMMGDPVKPEEAIQASRTPNAPATAKRYLSITNPGSAPASLTLVLGADRGFWITGATVNASSVQTTVDAVRCVIPAKATAMFRVVLASNTPGSHVSQIDVLQAGIPGIGSSIKLSGTTIAQPGLDQAKLAKILADIIIIMQLNAHGGGPTSNLQPKSVDDMFAPYKDLITSKGGKDAYGTVLSTWRMNDVLLAADPRRIPDNADLPLCYYADSSGKVASYYVSSAGTVHTLVPHVDRATQQSALAVAGAKNGVYFATLRRLGIANTLSAETEAVLRLVGADLSASSTHPDLSTLRSMGYTFAIEKASEGTQSTGGFADDWTKLRAAGVIPGAYHVFDPNLDPDTQAKTYLSHLQLQAGDLPPILSYASINGSASATEKAAVTRWLNIVWHNTNRKPIILATEEDWQLLSKDAGDYPAWIARAAEDEPQRQWAFWQYNNPLSTRQPTVATSLYVGNLNQLRQFIAASIVAHPLPPLGPEPPSPNRTQPGTGRLDAAIDELRTSIIPAHRDSLFSAVTDDRKAAPADKALGYYYCALYNYRLQYALGEGVTNDNQAAVINQLNVAWKKFHEYRSKQTGPEGHSLWADTRVYEILLNLNIVALSSGLERNAAYVKAQKELSELKADAKSDDSVHIDWLIHGPGSAQHVNATVPSADIASTIGTLMNRYHESVLDEASYEKFLNELAASFKHSTPSTPRPGG